MSEQPPVDRAAIAADLERARSVLHELLDAASSVELSRRSSGTRWTNEQLLFHMVFGYMVVRRLLLLIRMFSWLPEGASRRFAHALDAATPVFDEVNYRGSALARASTTDAGWAATSTASLRRCNVPWLGRRTRTCTVACTFQSAGIRSSTTT